MQTWLYKLFEYLRKLWHKRLLCGVKGIITHDENNTIFNEDYIKGMKFLLEKSKEQGINIRGVQWVPHVSEMLSKHNVCYKFWYNVWEQRKLDRVPLCETWYDVMFNVDKYLFSWGKSYEGHTFWVSMLSEVLKTSSIFNSETRTSSRRLCD